MCLLAPSWVKPNSLIAKMGKTQGIAFKIKPPKSAPASASMNPNALVSEEEEEDGEVEGAALAAFVAAAAAKSWALGLGHAPETGKTNSMPWRDASEACATSSQPIFEGLSLRAVLTGRRADQVVPCHDCSASACWSVDDSKSSGSLGKMDNFCPAQPGGRPSKEAIKKPPSKRAAFCGAFSWAGCCFSRVVNAWACGAKLLCEANCSPKSPSWGMHSKRQTSQLACNCTGSWPLFGAR